MRALFTQAARFQSWLDVEAALAELTIIPAEMPDSSIHGMRIGLCFRRSLISASGQQHQFLEGRHGAEAVAQNFTPGASLSPGSAGRRTGVGGSAKSLSSTAPIGPSAAR